ncbi:uncharacterized protein IL334_006503 [Kwoniella shivajii]|uniref:Uncharacterized protein n=1 Tax=Kwoniella shivajii TaxID=564305 RepID=A0ABZ1D653_9TREE|nr:hypothetical protein IL334_006503 [Kwoniella shivajii]
MGLANLFRRNQDEDELKKRKKKRLRELQEKRKTPKTPIDESSYDFSLSTDISAHGMPRNGFSGRRRSDTSNHSSTSDSHTRSETDTMPESLWPSRYRSVSHEIPRHQSPPHLAQTTLPMSPDLAQASGLRIMVLRSLLASSTPLIAP